MKVHSHITLVLAACACSLSSPPALAQSADPKRDAMIEERFHAADKNQDGKLTLEEARAGMPRVAHNFDRIDSDRRGYVTLEQIKKMAASR
jgi:Ca2+-binding EF-hand superfamily protein